MAVPPGTAGQTVHSISGAINCPDCVIAVDTVMTLGGLNNEGAEAILWNSRVAVDSRGRILVTRLLFSEIFVFSATGQLLRTVGRDGQGPGEYRGITHINVGPRYIHVFDRTGRTLLDHDFGFVTRTRLSGRVHQSYVTESDEVVWVDNLQSPASAGHPLHLLSTSGDIRSYGADDSSVHRGYVASSVVTGAGDALWSLGRESTRITRWNLQPESRIAEAWNRTVDEWERHDRGTWPAPRIIDVMRDELGLWIAWNAPDPNHPPGGAVNINTEPHQTIFDGWLDLVDPSTGKTIARYHGDDGTIGFAAGSRLFIAFHETEAGIPYIHLLNPRLSRADP